MAKGKSSASKGANKRMKKLVRSNSDGVTRGAIRRLARRAGARRLSGLVYAEAKSAIKSAVEATVSAACAFTESAKRKTVTAGDVVNALKRQGRMIYGYA